MRKNNLPLLFAVVIVSIVFPLGAQTKKPAPTPAKKPTPTHIAIDALQRCSECHEAESAQWTNSKHGQGMVQCLACHGSVHENFIPRPGNDRCVACHGSLVRNLGESKVARGKQCFQCHTPHTLDPHAAMTGGKR